MNRAVLRRVAAVAGPATLGIAGAAALWAGLPDVVLYVEGSPGALVLALGIAGSLAVAATYVVRWRLRAATAQAERRSERQERTNHLRFLLRLDHELKNPLTAIRAGLANLDVALAAGPPELARAALDSVAAQTARMASLLGDLRKLAELETAAVELSAVRVDDLLAEVAEAAGDLPELAGRQVLVRVPRAPWPLSPVLGDRDLLFLAVYNMVGNALKFTAPTDTVEVRAAEDGDRVLIEVADTGPGVPPDELGHIWGELARGSAARGTPGTGIGLALVRAVAARHGGAATLRSRQGQGTVVSLRIPIASGNRGVARVAGLRHDDDTAATARL